MEAVYPKLRRLARYYMAREPRDHTLQATALVHEAYEKLVEQRDKSWRNRLHFFAAASEPMRRILVDHARLKELLANHEEAEANGFLAQAPVSSLLKQRGTETDSMGLAPGTRLGPYEILSPIGKGGMGEVYRARDGKLGRDVAIKVLPEEFSQHKERLARFKREARLLASVNHPNVATLFGLEDADGIRFLVMELVEGETLAERIARGPIPIDEALRLFLQIATGLEAAHEKSVIHRDLKPANIKIGPEGSPKILDFGLAKGEFVQDVKSESPTVTRQETETGVILGTPAYMSPEQARGKTLDKRTDIWSFGCCLYEALTGKTAFLGETVSDTIAKILEGEPDWPSVRSRPHGGERHGNSRSDRRHCTLTRKRRRLLHVFRHRNARLLCPAFPDIPFGPRGSSRNGCSARRSTDALLASSLLTRWPSSRRVRGGGRDTP